MPIAKTNAAIKEIIVIAALGAAMEKFRTAPPAIHQRVVNTNAAIYAAKPATVVITYTVITFLLLFIILQSV